MDCAPTLSNLWLVSNKVFLGIVHEKWAIYHRETCYVGAPLQTRSYRPIFKIPHLWNSITSYYKRCADLNLKYLGW